MRTPNTLLAVGDVGPMREVQPEGLFELCAPTIRAADIAFCHVDQSYSERGSASVSRHAPRRAPSAALAALKTTGFDVVSFASNHGMDFGEEPFLDTLEALRRDHKVVGGGVDLDDARRPAIVTLTDGTRVGFLGYCSIVMGRLSGYIADVGKPGVAPLRARTIYEPMMLHMDYAPGTPPRTITLAYREDLDMMREDIEALRDQVDVLVVSQHCGVLLLRAHIAMYQFEIGRAAVDAGADIVLQHHAHILRGIEYYKGKPIFYGLGDFAWEASLTKAKALQPGRRETKQAEEALGQLNPAGTGAHIGPEERKLTMAAKFEIVGGSVQKVSYLPARTNELMQPSFYGPGDEHGRAVFDYMDAITREAGLKTHFEWDGDEVLVIDGASAA